MTDPEESDFWRNRFHTAALMVGFVAHAEGWLHDSHRVRRAAYHLYEHGEWPPDDGPTEESGCANDRKRVSELA